jgi:hypothetical protein
MRENGRDGIELRDERDQTPHGTTSPRPSRSPRCCPGRSSRHTRSPLCAAVSAARTLHDNDADAGGAAKPAPRCDPIIPAACG